MHNNYTEIKEIIHRYLRNNTLPKIAHLTNSLPNNLDRKYIIENFNYICFCAQNYVVKTEILLLLYMRKYKKIPLDVFVDIPEKCLVKRQFGYICLQYEDVATVHEMINFVSRKKKEINRNYPILLRLICVNEKIEALNMPNNTKVEKQLLENDIIFLVN